MNVILITQASSEYSITFAISPQDKEKAVAALQYEFRAEITEKAILVQVEEELSVIAIVGESMKDTPGISANLFQSLGRNGISVIATAQGSSELNISVVIRKKALKKALNVIHEGFFLSHIKELHLYIVGIGLVGSDLLRQIKQQQEKLMGLTNLKINVVCVSNSRKMLIDSSGINMDNYSSMLEENGEKADLNELVRRMRSMNLRNSVFVDCTANAEVSEIYADVLDSFVSIVAANKIACSSKYANYRKLKDLAVARNVKFMFETNVGAGLPIINTLNDLIRSGDRILAMQAVLSGTLNYIFNVLSEDIPLSKAILMAKEQGFSEPDPRIDLSGIDVVRKILILAREAEYELEQDQIEIKPFLPEECFEGTLDDFWTNVKKYDDDFEAKRKKLAENQKKWRFVAQLNEGKTSVELMEVDASHPAYNLEGSNNIILITTERYNEEPMVIKGYGAGASVTAAGIFADIIRIANV
jgi:aspartokinase/homoserine dehydrogenase 1